MGDFRWFHVKVVLVAGVGFFTDAYVSQNTLDKLFTDVSISYDIFAVCSSS